MAPVNSGVSCRSVNYPSPSSRRSAGRRSRSQDEQVLEYCTLLHGDGLQIHPRAYSRHRQRGLAPVRAYPEHCSGYCLKQPHVLSTAPGGGPRHCGCRTVPG